MANRARDIFLEAVRGEVTGRPAVASVNQTATYDQMEVLGVKWPEANFEAEAMARLAAGAYSVVGFDAVRVPFCQTIEQEALGCQILPGDAENLPSIGQPAYEPAQSPRFPDDFLQRGRVPVLIKALKTLKEMVGQEVCVIGGVIGPFSIAAELTGLKDYLKLCFINPSAVEPFLQVATQSGIALAQALTEAGADVICVEDMLASMNVISPKTYKEIAWPWQVKLIRKIGPPTILHICGRVDSILPEMIETGATALSFEPTVDLTTAKEAVAAAGRKIGLIGGVDTVEELFYGEPEMVRAAASKAVEAGYSVIAPGCSIPPAATIEKLKAMVEVVRGT